MGHFKYTLSNIWFWLIIVITCFFVENIALLSNGIPSEGFSNPVFYMLTALILAMMGVYFFLEHKKNHMTFNWVLLPALIIIFITLTIAIWTNPSSTIFSNVETGITAELTFSIEEKIRYTVQLLISLIAIYMMMFAYAKGRLRNRGVLWFAYLLIFTVVVAVVFSLFYEIDIYKNILFGTFSGEGTGSFFINPNIFGLCLMFGILACLIVNYSKPRWWAYLLIIFFFLAMIFTLCNTTLLISAVVIFCYVVARIVVNYINHHYIKASIFLFLIITLVVALLVVYLIGVAKGWVILISVDNFLKHYIFTNNFGTFSHRKEIWDWALYLVSRDPLRLAIGYGYGASSKLILTYSSIFGHVVRTCHSGYFEIFLMGGITGLVFYAAGVIFGFYAIIRLFIKKYYRFALLYLLIYFALLAHSFVESTHFFDASTSGAIIMILFYLPPIMVLNNLRKPQLAKEAIHNDVWQNSMSGHSVIRVISLVLVSLLIGLGLTFATSVPYASPFLLRLFIFGIVFIILSLLFLPYFVSLLYRHSSNKRFTFRLIALGLLLFGISGGLSLLLKYYYHWSGTLALSLGLGLYVALGFLLTNIYMVIYKGKPKIWFKETIHAIFITPGLAGPFMIIIGGCFTMIMNAVLPLDLLTLIVIILIDLFIFYLAFMFGPFKDRKELGEECNEEGLFNWRRTVAKEKI